MDQLFDKYGNDELIIIDSDDDDEEKRYANGIHVITLVQ